MRFTWALATLLIFGSTTAPALAAPFDLSGWTVQQYDFTANPSSWVLSSGNTVVTQTSNGDNSLFLSDFEVDHATSDPIRGSWRVNDLNGDDNVGFVLGYQNRGQYYLFNWKQADQGTSDGGMHLRILDVPGGADPTFDDLTSGADTSNMTILQQNDLAWAPFTDYEYVITFVMGGFQVEILQGATTLADWVISDSTYTAGQFGFYNASQPGSVYQASFVPEPSMVLLLVVGLMAMELGRRRVAG